MDASLPLLPLLAIAGLVVSATGQIQRTPDASLRALQDGNQRFARGEPAAKPTGAGARRTLARGDSPLAVVVACADATAAPEHVFDAALGDLVVARTAGHVASHEVVAAIEFAVEQQAVPLCVVLAHDGCSTVAAALAQADAAPAASRHGAHRNGALAACEPAVRAAAASGLAAGARTRLCEEEHAQATAQAILRQSPLLQQRAKEGRFRLVAARCQQATGVVDWLPARPLPQEPEAAATAVRQAPPNAPPQVALRALQAGHRRFLGDGQPTADVGLARREQVAHGSQPFAVVLACSDARVVPERLFDAGLGELCVVRLPGNVVTPGALAAAEQAVVEHGASLFVVLGHTGCTTIAAAAAGGALAADVSPSRRDVLRRLEPAVAAARAGADGRNVVDLAARAQALRSLAEARAQSPTLRAAEHDGKLLLLGAVYELASGDVTWLAEPTAKRTPDVADGHGHDGHAAHAATTPDAHGHGAHDGHDSSGPAANDGHGHAAPSPAAADHGAHGATPTSAATGEHDAHASHDDHGPTSATATTAGHDAHAGDDDHGHGHVPTTASHAADPAHAAPTARDPHGAHDGTPPPNAATHDLPVLDWAAMPPMPAGEAAPRAAPGPVTMTPWWRDPTWLAVGCGLLSLVAGELLLRRRRS